MKNLVLILVISALFTGVNFAQLKSDLAGNIIKVEDLPAERDLSINDFSFQQSSNGFINAQQTVPGVAFLSSAILPGSAQAANGKWARAGVYLAVEAFSIFYYINRNNVAKDQERAYEAFTHQEWSVVAYSQWLIGYYDNNGLSHDKLDQLRTMVGGLDPDFSDTRNDWNRVNINLLQEIERETDLVCGTCGSGDFSHVLPAYGSQQYYELISKYYQFEGGWSDFYAENVAVNNPNYNYLYDNKGDLASPLFLLGAERADRFNNNYRRAGNILNLLVINHVVSAFDALFSVKLKNAQVQASANMMRPDSFSLTLHF
ncbi:hypothetical protein A8B79_15370 [Balneola sp. EhC07]|uniref:hypothetical protein n=1 Tax=Balneola sp. EhC07 TaxID=1849360 RepID=UPI0007F51315|nr:hypothetical protein [Balneola sp. EhC07]OAN63451.1 hypothetical protein A8B79_15370 [Balneola sp. EhC07]